MSSRWQWRERIARYFFGDDVFISYGRTDATPYAAAVAVELARRNFAVRIDQWGTEPGTAVHPKLLRAVARSSVFLLISSDTAIHSNNVELEIATARSHGRPTVLVDLHGSITAAVWWPAVHGLHVSRENSSAAPSQPVVEKIINTIGFNRKDRRQRRATQIAAGTVAVLGALAIGLGGWATSSAKEARESRKLIGEAERNLGQLRRDGAAQRVATEAARQEAMEQAGHAARARKDAKEQTRLKDAAVADRIEAEEQRNQAVAQRVEAQAQTRTAVLRKLESDGQRLLKERPDAAIHVAFAAARLTDDLGPIRLLRAAAASLPIWFEGVPGGTKRDQLHLFGGGGMYEVAGADRALSRIVMPPDAAEKPSGATLRSIPDGRQLSMLPLSDGDHFLRPQPLATRLVAVERAADSSTALYDLEGAGFTQPVATIRDVKKLVLTNGDWPAYIVSADGAVSMYEPDAGATAGATASRLVGRWAGVRDIHPFPDPSQRAAVVEHDTGLSLFRFDGMTGVTSEIFHSDPDESYVQTVIWGPDASKLLFMTRSLEEKRTAIHAVSRSGEASIVAHVLGFVTDEKTVLRARGGRRVVMFTRGDSASEVEVLDIDWGRNDRVTVTKRPTSWFTHGVQRTNATTMVEAASITNDGNLLAVARSSFGISGTTTSSAVLELWSLKPLELQSTLAPTAVELKKGDGSPPSDMVFSADGARLLVTDANEVSTVYRIPLASEDVKQRLDPEVNIFGDGGRYRKVVYSPTDWRYYDLVTAKEIELSPLTSARPILDTALEHNAGRNTVVIATDRELLRVTAGRVTARSRVTDAQRAYVDTDVIVTQSRGSMEIHDSRTLKHLYTITLDPSFEPNWIAADGRDDIWLYAVSGKRLRTWRFRRNAGAPETQEIQFEVPSQSRTATRFFAAGDVFVLQIAPLRETDLFDSYDAYAPAPIVAYDLRTGRPRTLAQPVLTWPTGYGSMMGMELSDTGELTLILLYRERDGTRRTVPTTWAADGRYLRHTAIPFAGTLTASNVINDTTYLLLEDRDEVAYARVTDGVILWRSSDEGFRNFPPAILQWGGTWTGADTTEYRTVRRRIMMGGANSPTAFTHTAPPPEATVDLIGR